jgi:hypothetical protein
MALLAAVYQPEEPCRLRRRAECILRIALEDIAASMRGEIVNRLA